MLVGVLVCAARDPEGVVVVEHAKIGAGFRPEVVGLGRMNMGIVSAGSGQDIVVGGGVRDLLLVSLDGNAVPFTRLLMNGAFGF